MYYVYAYLREDETPYYIGKCDKRREFVKHRVGRPTDKSKIVFLEKNLTEVGALALERRYIRWYGRKDLGTGILRNLTDGGEGAEHAIRSPELRERLSKLKLGIPRSAETIQRIKENTPKPVGDKNGMFGKQHTEHTKELIRQKSLGRKYSIETNAKKGRALDKNGRAKSVMTPLGKFTTITLAACTLNVNYHTILNRVKSDSVQFAGYFWL